MSDFVRARGASGQITGEVLHVAVELDAPGHRWQCGPLCNADTSGRWDLTGTWARGWHRHARWSVCKRCTRELDRLARAVAEQTARAAGGAP